MSGGKMDGMKYAITDGMTMDHEACKAAWIMARWIT